MIKIDNVSKSYRQKPALVAAALELEAGRIVGLLGPNGSGKTTLLRILASELRADQGSVTIEGERLSPRLRAKVAALTTADFLPDSLTLKQAAAEYENFFPDFDPTLFYRLLKELDLSPEQRIRELSKGMKSKFALAITVARRARLIILDEPLEGVDPVAREEILGLIGGAFSEESTILVTSHLVNELERLLDEVYFIKEGHVQAMGDVEKLRAERGLSLDELYREVFRR